MPIIKVYYFKLVILYEMNILENVEYTQTNSGNIIQMTKVSFSKCVKHCNINY